MFYTQNSKNACLGEREGDEEGARKEAQQHSFKEMAGKDHREPRWPRERREAEPQEEVSVWSLKWEVVRWAVSCKGDTLCPTGGETVAGGRSLSSEEGRRPRQGQGWPSRSVVGRIRLTKAKFQEESRVGPGLGG